MIGPLELSGTISRSQDIAIIRHNEESKTSINQVNIAQVVQEESDEKSATVTMSGNVTNDGKDPDAKEESKNKYHGDGGKRNPSKPPAEGRVIVKGSSSGFDVRI